MIPDSNAELFARYDYLLREYERTRKGLFELRRALASLSATAESEDGLVTVRVGARGEVESLALNPRVYRRLTPTELADTIVATVRQAAANLSERAAEAYAPLLPDGISYERLRAGDGDPAAFLPDQPLTDATFDQWWSRWSGRSR